MDFYAMVDKALDAAAEAIRNDILVLRGTETERARIDLPLGEDTISFPIGMTSPEFDRCVNDAVQFLNVDGLSPAAKAVVRRAGKKAFFDWRGRNENYGETIAEEIWSAICIYISSGYDDEGTLLHNIGLELDAYITHTWQVRALDEIGSCLFGSTWQTSLARALEPYSPKKKLDTATLRRWLRGEYRAPPWAWSAMVELLRRKATEQSLLADRLQRLQNPPSSPPALASPAAETSGR
ncbi:hypothetical protein [Bosea beijingensis]|uniref:hypothetical protein n=1 Tax=Bosea beijingensis TaxID=3068632 RepID=UPI002740B142|nr:hypothetical protein [Bosea sp. REN20]